MTIRSKMLLVVGLTLGLLLLIGGTLHEAVRSGRANRDRMLLIQEQFDSLGRLQVASEQYLRALLRARVIQEDTSDTLRRFLATIDREETILKETSLQENEEETKQIRPDEWEETQEALKALRQWATQLEERIRTQSQGKLTLADEWKLFDEFEHDVGQLITQARAAEAREREEKRRSSERELTLAARLSIAVPTAAALLLLALILLVVVPMSGALRQLLAAARRVGEGDLHVSLPTGRRDELGMLSSAFNQMAVELRKVLEEKQRLMKAEAEANEREFRRYQAMLEETVHTRTAELERANVQLQESLQQLKAAQARLVFADRLAAMGQLAAGVGHEINNPLSFVLSNLHHLQKELTRLQDCLPPEDRQELLEVICEAREGAERVRLIVKDLKELLRPTEGTPGPVKLDEVVSSAAKLVSREFYERARLVTDCHGVPPVRGTVTRLGQVFLNLLINAAHAIPKGREEENEVRVVAYVSGKDQVTVEVRDTGCGIASEHLSHIFDPFFTTKPVGEGTGLGLSVCHSIVTSLGGEFQVSSELGKGTTFRIALPIATTFQQESTSPQKPSA
jgi:signal transduction histidine kinase